MEKPLAQAAGLGWQGKHTNLVSRAHGSWLFLGAIFTTLDLPPDTPEARSLRHLPGLPRHLSDRGISRAIPARCAALHFLSHHRAQRPDTARAAATDRQPHLWLRRLPGGLPLEQIRASRTRNEARGTRDVARAGACRAGSARRCRLSRAVHQKRGQAHRPRALPAQCADRRRQFRRCGAGERGRAACSTIPRRWCAAPAIWALGRLDRARLATRAAQRRAAETDADVAAEWDAALPGMKRRCPRCLLRARLFGGTFHRHVRRRIRAHRRHRARRRARRCPRTRASPAG